MSLRAGCALLLDWEALGQCGPFPVRRWGAGLGGRRSAESATVTGEGRFADRHDGWDGRAARGTVENVWGPCRQTDRGRIPLLHLDAPSRRVELGQRPDAQVLELRSGTPP